MQCQPFQECEHVCVCVCVCVAYGYTWLTHGIWIYLAYTWLMNVPGLWIYTVPNLRMAYGYTWLTHGLRICLAYACMTYACLWLMHDLYMPLALRTVPLPAGRCLFASTLPEPPSPLTLRKCTLLAHGQTCIGRHREEEQLQPMHTHTHAATAVWGSIVIYSKYKQIWNQVCPVVNFCGSSYPRNGSTKLITYQQIRAQNFWKWIRHTCKHTHTCWSASALSSLLGSFNALSPRKLQRPLSLEAIAPSLLGSYSTLSPWKL